MDSLILKSGNTSLVLTVDEANNVVKLEADNGNNPQTRLEINTKDLSIALYNDSDIGLIVDDAGLTTIHRLKIEGELTMQNPETGNWFSYRPDANGVLVGTPANNPL